MSFGKWFAMYGKPMSKVDVWEVKRREYLAGRQLTDLENVEPWVFTPPGLPEGTQMFSFRVSDDFMDDIERTAEYLNISVEALGRLAMREFMKRNPAP